MAGLTIFAITIDHDIAQPGGAVPCSGMHPVSRRERHAIELRHRERRTFLLRWVHDLHSREVCARGVVCRQPRHDAGRDMTRGGDRPAVGGVLESAAAEFLPPGQPSDVPASGSAADLAWGTVLVEREEQIAPVQAWLVDPRPMVGQVLLLEGTVGVGKTEFLRAVTERVVPDQAILLHAVCSPEERDLPFGILRQLFDNPALPVDVRQRISAVLRGLMESAFSEVMHEAVERHRATILYDFLPPITELAASTRLVVCIDDIHHMDSASQECLLHLVRRMSSAPLLMVLTELAEPRRTHSPFHAELLRQSSLVSTRLAPLSSDGVRALIGLRLGAVAARRLGDGFIEYSGGNPLLLDALINDERLYGEVRQQGYGRALLACLYRSGPDTLRVARAMAVYGDDASPKELGTLIDADVATVERALRSMTEAGLLRLDHFPHAVAPRTVLDDLPARDREELHHRAARLLRGQGASAVDIAAHLTEAGQVPEPWALRVLLEAASEALLHDEVHCAVRYLDSAQRSCSSEKDLWTIQAKAAQAEWQLNPLAALRHLMALTEVARAGRLDQHEATLLVRQLLWLNRTHEAADVLALLRKRAAQHQSTASPVVPGVQEEPAELHDLELWLACTYPALAGRVPIGATPTGPEGAPTTRSTTFWLKSIGALSGGLIRRRSGETQEWAAHALGQLDLSHNAPWAEEATLLALMSLVYSGRLGEAADRCRGLEECRKGRPSPMWQSVYDAAEAEIRLRRGEFPQAVRHARSALEHIPVQGWGTAVGLPLGTLILAHARLGEFDEATALVSRSVPDDMFQSRYGLHYLYARGQYYLATDRTRAALGDFLSCGELMRKWGLDLPGIVPWRTSAAEAWLLQGNRDRAKRLVKEQLAISGPEDAVSRALALRLMAVCSSLGQRPRLLGEAADILEAADCSYELARTLSDLGRAHHALGKHRRARVIIRRAWHVAHLCKAEPLCQELLPDIRGDARSMQDAEGTTALASLTNSERRIASMAVKGYTNREIAEKLFITPSTVEQHLTRVYRKLAVKNRQSLPGYLRSDAG
ncbi:LuxR C-terminal-related transcriptional regulator [Streptomyces monashensis]|uniref:helix-turn-helix transcriptional regulator n=1 Tax=Streptomyces monashensis TaxID=1678012 RepID=UPI0033E2502D